MGPSDNKTEESKSIESQLEQATDRHKALTPEIEKPYEQVNQDTEQNVTKIYYIIVGSYVTTDQAKKLQSELIYQGYNSEILISGKKVRVSLKRFSDKEIAVAELEKIRKMKGFEQAWLLAD